MMSDLTGFMFDDVHSSTMGLYIQYKPPFLPPTRDVEEEIPGRDGVYDFGFTFDKRMIVVDCFLFADNSEDLDAKLGAIAAWLDPRKGFCRLIFDKRNDRYFNARYSGQVELETFACNGKFQIPFKCADPYAYMIADGSRVLF